MKNPGGHNYELVQVRPSQIKYADYQRKVNMKRVEQIDAEYDGDVQSEPKLSYRDGVYYCFDGQHTISMWMRKFGDKPITCKVYKGLTYTDEARLFAKQTGRAIPPTSLTRFSAQVKGRDPETLKLVRAINAAGYTISEKTTKDAHKITAVTALEQAWDTLERNPDMMTAVFKTLNAAYPNDHRAVSGNIIGGMALFFKTYRGKFTEKELVKSLKKQGASPNDLIAYANIYGKQATRQNIAKAILAKYNAGRSSRRLEGGL